MRTPSSRSTFGRRRSRCRRGRRSHEGRDLERQRHPCARGAVRRVGAPRPAGRRVPAGDQGHCRAARRIAHAAARVLELLARRPEGLQRRVAPPPQGDLPDAARVQSPGLRRREPRRAGRGSTTRASSRASTSRTAARTTPRSCASSRRCAPTCDAVHVGGTQADPLRRPERRPRRTSTSTPRSAVRARSASDPTSARSSSRSSRATW